MKRPALKSVPPPRPPSPDDTQETPPPRPPLLKDPLFWGLVLGLVVNLGVALWQWWMGWGPR